MKTTYRIALQQAAPDLVERNFTSEEPDRLWVADITYVRSGEGLVYLAFILDVCSRQVVGWSMATHLTASFSEHDPHRMVHTYGLHKGPN